jgi:hypothetical protein
MTSFSKATSWWNQVDMGKTGLRCTDAEGNNLTIENQIQENPILSTSPLQLQSLIFQNVWINDRQNSCVVRSENAFTKHNYIRQIAPNPML